MSTWISRMEAAHLSKVAKMTEEMLMWGETFHKRKELKLRISKLHNDNMVSKEDFFSLMRITDSPAGDDLQFAETLIETIINKHVGNISITESQVSEPRSQ